MTTAGVARSGSCLCGAVRFAARPEKREISACHSGICRKWCGAPWLGVGCGNTLEVEDAGAPGVYRSSEWAERCCCRSCGTALCHGLVDWGLCWVSADAFDDLAGFAFAEEIFIDEKPDRYDFANDARKLTGAEVFELFDQLQEAGHG